MVSLMRLLYLEDNEMLDIKIEITENNYKNMEFKHIEKEKMMQVSVPATLVTKVPFQITLDKKNTIK